jgi:hypothetical protein
MGYELVCECVSVGVANPMLAHMFYQPHFITPMPMPKLITHNS